MKSVLSGGLSIQLPSKYERIALLSQIALSLALTPTSDWPTSAEGAHQLLQPIANCVLIETVTWSKQAVISIESAQLTALPERAGKEKEKQFDLRRELYDDENDCPAHSHASEVHAVDESLFLLLFLGVAHRRQSSGSIALYDSISDNFACGSMVIQLGNNNKANPFKANCTLHFGTCLLPSLQTLFCGNLFRSNHHIWDP